MYCRCGNTVHPVRIDLGYKTCVECSTTQTYSYVPIIEHKTGNTIQIVSQEVSASVHRAWRRKYLTKFESTLLTTGGREMVRANKVRKYTIRKRRFDSCHVHYITNKIHYLMDNIYDYD